MRLLNLVREAHVGALRGALEERAHALTQDDRRDRPPWLSPLDRVQPALDAREQGGRQEAAPTERARPELRSPGRAGEDVPPEEQAGDGLDRLLRCLREVRVVRERGLHARTIVRRAEPVDGPLATDGDRGSPATRKLAEASVRTADRDPSVVRRAGHVIVVEERAPDHVRVRQDVEEDTPGGDEPPRHGERARPLHVRYGHRLQRSLHRARQQRVV